MHKQYLRSRTVPNTLSSLLDHKRQYTSSSLTRDTASRTACATYQLAFPMPVADRGWQYEAKHLRLKMDPVDVSRKWVAIGHHHNLQNWGTHYSTSFTCSASIVPYIRICPSLDLTSLWSRARRTPVFCHPVRHSALSQSFRDPDYTTITHYRTSKTKTWWRNPRSGGIVLSWTTSQYMPWVNSSSAEFDVKSVT